MSLHDSVRIGGVTENCKYNCHTECNNPACSCDCHVKAKVIVDTEASALPSTDPKPEKSCPQCGTKRPYTEDYCRLDGVKLTSLMCRVCGVGREPSDLYCWKCGTVTAAPTSSTSSTLTVPATLPVTDTISSKEESEVLKAIQAELREAQGAATAPENVGQGSREVIEQPGGSQGSFKIVSSPNPNKVRPQSPASQPSKPAGVVKLPVKPS